MTLFKSSGMALVIPNLNADGLILLTFYNKTIQKRLIKYLTEIEAKNRRILAKILCTVRLNIKEECHD
ncbi:hypothetical protein [Tepidimicrobium xylanilyticum]|uniref:Uncharacterized protein n=1 Tax=Tepidimicrobium xylanilyticum TaxID=1123352 RepID=A0A1H3C160_9FIRM|nr:hypothetical protein [Tepidimicrobium xylanilyticum]GMG97316.1 hypothetical protein EN5CB1_21420 [Tepidimicrobium xylanilyticum]SDX47771.1 hypothetical protein SAMN05660923_02383 [Tepidimicrobium xylanilyticum]